MKDNGFLILNDAVEYREGDYYVTVKVPLRLCRDVGAACIARQAVLALDAKVWAEDAGTATAADRGVVQNFLDRAKALTDLGTQLEEVLP